MKKILSDRPRHLVLKTKIIASVLLSSIVIATMRALGGSHAIYRFSSLFLSSCGHTSLYRVDDRTSSEEDSKNSSRWFLPWGELSQREQASRGRKSGIHQLLVESALLSFQTAEFSRVPLLLKQHCSLVCVNLWFERNALVH